MKVITVGHIEASCLHLIHSGIFSRSLAELKEREAACLNKETIQLYIEAYEALERAKPAIDRLIEASQAELKRHHQAKSN